MVRFTIPIRLPSLANSRMHWTRMARLKRAQRCAVMYCMVGLEIPKPPLVITITRCGPKALDDDNLANACKYIRDEIAEIIGVDDGSSLYTWRYGQRIGKREGYNVIVEITERKEKSCIPITTT